MQTIFFFFVVFFGLGLSMGCNNKCPESLEDDTTALSAMPENNKDDSAAAAKKCDELVTKYKSNDRCDYKDNQEFLLENLKEECARLHTNAK
jgi:hypothetical protein